MPNKHLVYIDSEWVISIKAPVLVDERAAIVSMIRGGLKVFTVDAKPSGHLYGLHDIINNLEGNAFEIVKLDGMCLGGQCSKPIVDALSNSVHLRAIECLMSVIRDDGAVALAKALQHCPSLRVVRLVEAMISHRGALALLTRLPLEQLEDLNLGGNGLSVDTMKELASAMRAGRLRKLKKLGLVKVDMCDEGLLAVCEALPNCPSIKTLLLSRNLFEQPSVAALAQMLGRCPTLQAIGLTDNNFTNLDQLAVEVRHHPALETLDLTHSVAIGDEEILRFAEVAFHPNVRLKYLHTYNSKVSAATRDWIIGQLAAYQCPLRAGVIALIMASYRDGFRLHRRLPMELICLVKDCLV
mgnify:CR=1 FL=1